jgi:HD-GYP domain-containing protein (c-di-GMP phosphodiesterase class II)
MYVSKHAGGNRVSTAEEFVDGENFAAQRQQIAGYIEGFLQREQAGTEQLEELVATLKKLSGGEEQCNAQVLRESIEQIARAAESREFHAAGHGDMVARCSELIGKALSLPPDEMTELVYAARVHDVGKIFVPERIVTKNGPLNEEEYTVMKTHARIGAEIVSAIPGSGTVESAIEHHHESFDGNGYPRGLRGEEIPLWARIVGLADAYVNFTTEQALTPAKTSEQALVELEKLSGTRFDGMLVRILIRQLRAERTSSVGD